MQKKIDNLIAKKLSGNLTEQEAHAFETWLAADEANRGHYAEAQKIWRVSGSLRNSEDQPDVNAAWQQFTILAETAPVKISRPTVFYLKAAAAIFFIISTFLVMRLVIVPGSEQAIALSTAVTSHTDTFMSVRATSPAVADCTVAENQAAVPEKVRSTRRRSSRTAMIAVSSEDSAMVFTLPDNSRVYLNKNSKLVYPEKFNGKERKIYLSGEAYFELAASAAEFFVYCHDTRTRVMGTALNVKGLRDGVVEISAISGDVEVSKANDPNFKSLHVKAGEQVVYNTVSHDISKSRVSKKDKWWKRGSFRMLIREFFNKILHPNAEKNTEK